MSRLYLSPPDVSPEDRASLIAAFDSGWIAPVGPDVNAFETELAAATGRAHACALSSGTAALHLALVMLGVERGDRVLVSTLTFVASANAVRYVGAEPVFIDSELKSWNMDPDLLAEELAVSAKAGKLPKAVIVVDIYGQCADYNRIETICAEYQVPIIEDAAESLGATYAGRPAGSFGKMAILSFNGNKIITTSGGGAIVASDPKWTKKASFLATQARDPAPNYQHSELGFNYRLSNLLAALGKSQLADLSRRVGIRRAHNAFYRRSLAKIPGINFMPEAPDCKSTFWLTTITIDPSVTGITPEGLRIHLEEQNLETRPVWKPMHMQPYYKGCEYRGLGISEHLFEYGLCLPSGSTMLDMDRDRVKNAMLSKIWIGANNLKSRLRHISN